LEQENAAVAGNDCFVSFPEAAASKPVMTGCLASTRGRFVFRRDLALLVTGLTFSKYQSLTSWFEGEKTIIRNEKTGASPEHLWTFCLDGVVGLAASAVEFVMVVEGDMPNSVFGLLEKAIPDPSRRPSILSG